jgi:hypothetical protein
MQIVIVEDEDVAVAHHMRVGSAQAWPFDRLSHGKIADAVKAGEL